MTNHNINKRLHDEEVRTNLYNEYFTIDNDIKLYYYGLYENLCIEEDKKEWECQRITVMY